MKHNIVIATKEDLEMDDIEVINVKDMYEDIDSKMHIQDFSNLNIMMSEKKENKDESV